MSTPQTGPSFAKGIRYRALMKTPFSIELFPPKTDAGMEKMQQAINNLRELAPEYVSVTYGAGGSTRERTFATVDWLMDQGMDTAPHLSCIGSDRNEINAILQRYRDQGITRLVALRGDLPSGAGLSGLGEFNYANELVSYIREHFGEHFHIEVAAYPETHPQANSIETDLINFRRKVQAGAQGAITQYFYNADAYFHFIDRCRAMGLDTPIVPGIMPITNYAQLSRFSEGCGAEIPRWARKQLQAYGDDLDSIRAFGLDLVAKLCERLLAGGAPSLHFYTMNQALPTRAIVQRLTD
jgi:methylenetetrahydrofolate reductase (NADPH)